MNDYGIEADCEEDYSLPLVDLPWGPMVSSSCAGSAGCRWQGSTGGPGNPDRVGKRGRSRGVPCASPRIALRQRFEEEKLVLRREVPLDEQDDARCPSLTGCQMTVIMYQKLLWQKATTSTRALGAHWSTIPWCWSSHNVKREWTNVPRIGGSQRNADRAPTPP